MSVITRFAPSPTGYMHIGNARTALFNFLFARHHRGTFLLRIEDTDQERHTPEAVEVILDTLQWLGIPWDGEPVFQSKNQTRHQQVVQELLDQGKAYYCYCTPEELERMREKALKQGKSPRYEGVWRDRSPSSAPKGLSPAVRLKMPLEGETTLEDLIQGKITVKNEELDDMVLLRSDGTPTYMLSVVVDDHDMHITHVIRGSDHLTNAFRQVKIFEAMGWKVPHYAHIPLIHGPDGAKLSKRHGSLGAESYRELGYLSEALCNYLLKLGWGHGDDEVIHRAQAIEWFSLAHVQKSPARFDLAKLTHLNGHYLRETPSARLVDLVSPFLSSLLERSLTEKDTELLRRGMDELKVRAKTLLDLADSAQIYVASRPIPLEESIRSLLDESSCLLLRNFYPILSTVESWTPESLEKAARSFVDEKGVKLGKLAQPLRAALTGRAVSPGIFDVMLTLEREESLARIQDVLKMSKGGR